MEGRILGYLNGRLNESERLEVGEASGLVRAVFGARA